MACPESADVALLRERLLDQGMLAEEQLVGDLWEAMQSCVLHESRLRAEIQLLGGDPPVPELKGAAPLVLYFPSKEEAQAFAQDLQALMTNPIEFRVEP